MNCGGFCGSHLQLLGVQVANVQTFRVNALLPILANNRPFSLISIEEDSLEPPSEVFLCDELSDAGESGGFPASDGFSSVMTIRRERCDVASPFTAGDM